MAVGAETFDAQSPPQFICVTRKARYSFKPTTTAWRQTTYEGSTSHWVSGQLARERGVHPLVTDTYLFVGLNHGLRLMRAALLPTELNRLAQDIPPVSRDRRPFGVQVYHRTTGGRADYLPAHYCRCPSFRGDSTHCDPDGNRTRFICADNAALDHSASEPFCYYERRTGYDPATSCLASRCSTN